MDDKWTDDAAVSDTNIIHTPKKVNGRLTRATRRRLENRTTEEIKDEPASVASDTNGSHGTFHYEFGGPLGALATIIALPLVIYFLYYSATKSYKFNFTNANELLSQFPPVSELYSAQALVVVLVWFVFNVALERCLYYQKAEGALLKTGERLSYRLSGHLQFWVVLLIMIHGYPSFNTEGDLVGFTHFPLSWLYDHFIHLATAAIIVSFALSVFLYIKSFTKGALLAEGGDSGNLVYDFFIGRELNPRFGDFDWKEFCELRPGLLGWMIINIGCMVKQHELLGVVTLPMLMINVFQGLYVFDALYHEAAILTTMDITTDGFGFMLAFGDLAWVPFTYSLQARYLVENSPEMSLAQVGAICALNFLGYYIFRGSNSEKDAFRRDPTSPDVEHFKTLTTKSGRKLLVSGWWGVARKINYTGDWCMGLAWCLTTGFGCIVTYFYAIYFFILLVHRALRDDHACTQKYGADWPRYKEKVPYIFIPYVV